MNLTNYEKTPIFRVFETVKREAARYGVTILESEIVGLVPAAALIAAAEFYLQLERFGADQVLENKLRTATTEATTARSSDDLKSRSTAIRPSAVASDRLLFLPARRRDAERAHLPVEIAALDAERVGGARDVAVLRGERAQDVVALEALARVVQRQRAARRRVRRGARRRRRGTPGRRARSCRPAP